MLSNLRATVWLRRLIVVSVALMLLMMGGQPISAAGEPDLSIPSNISAYNGLTVSVPISFTSDGSAIASTTFSVDFDESCLAFDPTDDDGDGTPDAVSFKRLPSAFGASVAFNGSDSDGELDFFIGDTFPPLASLPDGTLATVTFTATCSPTVVAPVSFSDAPAASFGNTGGLSVAGTTTSGSVEIIPPPDPHVQIDQIIPNPSNFGEIVEFNGSGTSDEISRTLDEYEWTLLAVGESCGSVVDPPLLGDRPRLLTNSIAEGEHRVCLRAKNIADVWSDYATETLTVRPDRWEVSDIALSRDGMTFWKDADATDAESNPDTGDQVYIKVRVDNIGISDTTDETTVSVYDGDVETGTLIGSETIDFIAAGSDDYVIIPWTPGANGYQVLTADIEYTENIPYFANDPLPPYPEPHFESRYDNNQATGFIVVGPPIEGEYDILVTADISPIGGAQLYAGYAANLFGDAHYNWGSQIPTMGAETTIEIKKASDLSSHGVYSTFTTAPSGRYASIIELPIEPGDYLATVRVFDNNLAGTTYIEFTVLEAPEPRPDLYVQRFTVGLSGDGVYRRTWHRYAFNRVYYHSGLYGVRDEPIVISAKVRNRGNADAGTFKVSFYDGKPGSGGTLLGTTTVSGLASGASTTATYDWTPSETGSYVIQVVVDEVDEVTESNELNNYDSYYYRYQTYFNNRVHRDMIEIREAKPDLRALGLSYAAEPNLGDVIGMTVNVHNIGHANIASGEEFTVTVYDGYPGVADTRVLDAALELGPYQVDGPMNPGDFQTLNIVWNTHKSWTEPGLHHICVEVDTDGEIDEEFEENNVNCWNLYVFPNEADLWPVALSFSTYAPLPSEEITIIATMRNMGAIEYPATGSDTITFYLGHPNNGDVIGTTTLNGPIAGRRGTGSVSIPWTTPDSHGLAYIYVEYVKDDGYKPGPRRYVRRLNVRAFPPPNLRVRSADIDVTPEGGGSRVSADIRNIAAAIGDSTTATDFTVKFYTDGPTAGLVQLGSTLTVSSLAGGDTTTVEANALFVPTDPYYVIKVEAMPRVEQGDADFRDNEATTSIGVDLVVTNDSPTILCAATTFSANVPGESGLTFHWDFGDGSSIDNNDGETTHTYTSPGEYTVTVTTEGFSPELTTTTIVTVQDTDCAITGLLATNDGPTPVTHLTTLTANTITGDNVTYTWDFGDSSPSVTGPDAEVTHTYPAIGTYTATVTASNSVSSQTATTDVTITELWGDANGDGKVDAADITALVLEIFDGDGSDPADTPGGTYPGTPACDANQDGNVDAADITCITLIIFNGPGACN